MSEKHKTKVVDESDDNTPSTIQGRFLRRKPIPHEAFPRWGPIPIVEQICGQLSQAEPCNHTPSEYFNDSSLLTWQFEQAQAYARRARAEGKSCPTEEVRAAFQQEGKRIGLLGSDDEFKAVIDDGQSPSKVALGIVARYSTLLPAVVEEIVTAEEERRQKAMDDSKAAADFWRDFHGHFKSMAAEERTEEVARNDRWLRAHGDYSGPDQWDVRSGLPVPPKREYGAWQLSGGVSEEVRERFVALATRAGTKLDPPQGAGVTPSDFWLHCLFLYLRENNSKLLFAGDHLGGIIVRVCEASAAFCARLETKALEAVAAGGDVWDRIDHYMVEQKMANFAVEESKWFEQEEGKIRSHGNRAAFGAELMRLGIEDMERRAKGISRIFAEGWEAQGYQRTPEFVRRVFQKAIAPAIDGRAKVAAERLKNLAARTRNQAGLAARIMELQRVADRLKSQWERKAEIEARELEHKQKRGKTEEIAVQRRRQPRKAKKIDKRERHEPAFTHHESYSSVRFRRKVFPLTSQQAQVVELLHRAYEGGTPELSQAYILEKLGTSSSRLRDTFRRTELWGRDRLIVPGERRGNVRLNLPDLPRKR